MSNKTQLQLNNETLASILSNVLGLPSQESLKHGAYVWKKYTTTPIYVENSSKFYRKVVTTEPQNAAITYEFSTTYTFDENTGLFTLGSGGGISVPYDSSGEISTSSKYYMIGTRTGITMYQNGDAPVSPTLYNNVEGVTILAYNNSHFVTEYQSELIYEKSDFIDFVVSDQETAHPDGGVQGGYWYEKVVEGIPLPSGFTKYAVDKFTISQQTNFLSLSHSLGLVPRFILIVSPTIINGASSSSYYVNIYAQVFGDDTTYSAYIVRNSSGKNYTDFCSVTHDVSSGMIFCATRTTTYLFHPGTEYTLITMA